MNFGIAGDIAPAEVGVVAVAEHNRLAVAFDHDRATVNHRKAAAIAIARSLAKQDLGFAL